METNYWKKHPYINVGILEAGEIAFVLNGTFSHDGQTVAGEQTVKCRNGRIDWQGQSYEELTFAPMGNEDSFTLKDVVIGIDFHWERREQQRFAGSLMIIVDKDRLVAINRVHIEDYLLSVISSEMNASSSLEFLKAAAVISRSWLLKQIENRHRHHDGNTGNDRKDTPQELVSWNDREDHLLFDVCADDHCQRYQGIQKASSPTVGQAIRETTGMVLTSDGEICDARFYKCCGGVTEEYKTCWENLRYTYLSPVRDNAPATDIPDLKTESEARKWICSSPEAFCNTQDKAILRQVLNDYDMETSDFYRWKQVYSQAEIKALIEAGTDRDLGDILDLVPLERGRSGRIYRLRIVGSRNTYTIGKELVIRRVLSTSHLYSSAFVVDKEDIQDGIPGKFILHGAGWGHGAGLCQIGAAVMGARGYSYQQILLHYYNGAEIEKAY